MITPPPARITGNFAAASNAAASSSAAESPGPRPIRIGAVMVAWMSP